MPSHPQTATERFLRHGVAGGYTVYGHVPFFDEEEGFVYETPCEIDGSDMFIRMKFEQFLLDPTFWQACGRSLGWEKGVCGECVECRKMDIECGVHTSRYKNHLLGEWQFRWHGLLDWLAAHPGDVEGYLGKIIGGKENV